MPMSTIKYNSKYRNQGNAYCAIKLLLIIGSCCILISGFKYYGIAELYHEFSNWILFKHINLNVFMPTATTTGICVKICNTQHVYRLNVNATQNKI